MFNLTNWKKRNLSTSPTTTEHPLNRIRAEVDSLFDRFFADMPGFWTGGWNRSPFWGVELEDMDQAVAVRVEAPGFEAEDFDIHVAGNLLTIQAERKEGGAGDESQSFSRRRLQRSVALPAGVEPDKVEARYRNGILELILPKQPSAQGRRIQVKNA